MKSILNCSSFRSLCVTAMLALVCSASTGLAQGPAANVADKPAGQALAEKAAKMPVTATFEKVKTEDGPPYVLKLKNTAKEDIEVTVTVLLSVVSHNRDKARHVPAHVIPAGATWTVDGLAALDKVTVAAKGHAPLELEVK